MPLPLNDSKRPGSKRRTAVHSTSLEITPIFKLFFLNEKTLVQYNIHAGETCWGAATARTNDKPAYIKSPVSTLIYIRCDESITIMF